VGVFISIEQQLKVEGDAGYFAPFHSAKFQHDGKNEEIERY